MKINICMEAPVDIIVNEKKLATFMCTPKDLEDLAIGHLYSRDMLKNIDDFISATSCESNRRLLILTKSQETKPLFNISNVILSGCGNGSIFNEDILEKESLNIKYSKKIDVIKEAFLVMQKQSVMYNTMGGMHCSAIFDDKDNIFVREDIGRHNAVDKVIGAALKERVNLENSIIMTSGRISLDMVLKAAGARIPIIVSLSIASDLAIEVATKLGICLIGRVKYPNPIVYNDFLGGII
ncbi:formate dehydrogenase accessory sulfurtransferase FdhD [Cetobacterium sp. 2A]|uniref:formate dehydrogenase accessory sulfurtransferase FdhD n=1 Tax=unclassified Cetobacterium TaxID=2630983 RepID=UPI00163BBAF9|nr:formate dehydrogenase accessory sulfurtransferase FdhD [Cetobacterium sp. 2A]MBC2854988.1 formate dehydrogenase accessory sulfurtransferase FdhD [Cetobacterium sp. 2A]